jgi:hypothetical protein
LWFSTRQISELFATHQGTSTLFTEACRVPGSNGAESLEFKRFVEWRISPVFVACRISDVKAESGLSRRARTIASGNSTESLRQTEATLAPMKDLVLLAAQVYLLLGT